MAVDRHHRQPRERGFIIVAVLWILLALATLALIYDAYVVRTAEAVGSGDRQVRAQAMFTAALEMTAYQLTAMTKDKRPAVGRFDFRLGRASALVAIRSEAGLIDLNSAQKPLLTSLFTALGARPADAESDADRVIAWRTPAPQTGDDVEAAAYQTAGLTYAPRHGPFADVGELWLVLGLPPALIERALPYVTVFNGAEQVNVLAAPPLVLAALPGMTPDQVNNVLAARRSATLDPQAVLAVLAPTARAAATIAAGAAVLVSVDVRLADGSRATADVVILLTDDANAPEPYRILSWRDDFDQIASAGG